MNLNVNRHIYGPMSSGQLTFTIAFGILFWILPYFIGLYISKKIEILKKH